MNEREGASGNGEGQDGPLPTVSAGEMGQAADATSAGEDAGLGEVIVGEIPDPHDLSHMLWTARCTIPAHGLLGTFEEQQQAESARHAHLLGQHGGPQL
jgi:hypothetical protein